MLNRAINQYLQENEGRKLRPFLLILSVIIKENCYFCNKQENRMKKYLKLLRVEQWVKNLFVFGPLFFSGNFFHQNLLLQSFFAFIVFSLTASSIYIVNDYMDIESDKKHPEKKNRPLASGAISKPTAVGIFVLLGKRYQQGEGSLSTSGAVLLIGQEWAGLHKICIIMHFLAQKLHKVVHICIKCAYSTPGSVVQLLENS